MSGTSNEMFSDFESHVIGVPQIVPRGSNVVFDGPGQNEDFGLEQVTGDPADRYKFRTSPLRNVAIQPAFFHNGSFTRLEDAVVVCVRDDGKGLPQTGAERSGRFGVAGMRERVQSFGGTFAISGAPGEGVELRAVLPAAGAKRATLAGIRA